MEDTFGSHVSNDSSNVSVRRFTLTNNKGMSMQVITYGATITVIKVPDKNGQLRDVVLGYDQLEGYLKDKYYLGCTVGRCANRISNASFSIGDSKYNVDVNVEPNNHLHGGLKGFDKVIWDANIVDNILTLSYTSPNGECGYPGDVKVTVLYQLTEENDVIIKYKATSTQKTPINLTNHSYFNLGGHDAGTINNHIISINADHYTPLDHTLITTGEIARVDGTPLDLRKPCKLGSAILKVPEGFDHNYCVNGEKGQLNLVSRVLHSDTGIVMEVFSTQHGVQFYTANFFPEDDSLVGKEGVYYHKQGAFCLETQNYPDAVNKPNFPNCIIGPGDVYEHTTIYKFSTQ